MGRISQQGYCLSCGTTRLTDELEQLKYRRGPYYARWREAILAGVLGTPDP